MNKYRLANKMLKVAKTIIAGYKEKISVEFSDAIKEVSKFYENSKNNINLGKLSSGIDELKNAQKMLRTTISYLIHNSEEKEIYQFYLLEAKELSSKIKNSLGHKKDLMKRINEAQEMFDRIETPEMIESIAKIKIILGDIGLKAAKGEFTGALLTMNNEFTTKINEFLDYGKFNNEFELVNEIKDLLEGRAKVNITKINELLKRVVDRLRNIERKTINIIL